MIQSMTGFAEKNYISKSLNLKVTIKSLNHRFVDWSYKGTPLGEEENRLRAICQKKIQRGRIEVFMEMGFPDPASWNPSVNEALLEKIISSLEAVSSRLGKPLNLSLDQILRIPQVLDLSRKAFTRVEIAFIEAGFDRTLDEVVRQRIKEGKKTAAQLVIHVREIGRSVNRIERQFKRQPALIQGKLKQRLMDLNHSSAVSEDRLAEETAYLTQRSDLAEEILRLKSHVGVLKDLLSPGAEGPLGKKLDFLAQEIHREANTTGSKSQDLQIIKESLAIKSQVESIRQHAQNIE